MKRVLLALAFLLATGPARAETVVVRSGEHADFSRLVVALDRPGEWVFGRVPSGYELRLKSPSVAFDSSRVFDLIPRTRIANLSEPGPGRLRLELGCKCSGDAFEMSDGRIVIDISDGPPRPGSPFETVLDDPAPAAPPPTAEMAARIAPPPRSSPSPGRDTVIDSRFLDLPENWSLDGGGGQRANVPPPAAMRTPASGPAPASGPDPAPPPVPDLTLALLSSPAPVAQAAPPDSAAPTQSTDPPGPPPSETRAARETWSADRQADLFLGSYAARSQRVADTRDALLRQLSRAAAQGVIKITGPTLDTAAMPTEQAATEPDSPTTGAPEQAIQAGDPAERHLNITTVVDRDKPVRAGQEGLTDEGLVCLAPELTDVAGWGPEDPAVSPLDALRTTLVMEFDKPNPTAIATLARRYIYLGFGAEAKALIKAFDVDLDNRDILLQLAEIMDAGQVDSPGPLPDQVSCRTEVAMWAILAQPKIRAGADIDKKAVLRAFSALPPHLRELLGPTLADRFLETDDIDTATAIRNLIDRALGQRDAGFRILEASIDSREGDTQAAIEKLQAVAMEGGPREADAVASLLEAKLETGAPISESTALLAESLAVEYRGSALGNRLTRAAILGFAKSGRIAATFERINIALERGDLDRREADALRLATHLHNAQQSSDVDFLTNFFANQVGPEAFSSGGAATRRAIAERLLSLGLPDSALALYGPGRGDLEKPDRLLRARAQLAAGRAAQAQGELQGLEGPEAERLVARALEMQRDFEGAARILSRLDLAPDAASAAWRAGDFAKAAAMGPSGFQAAAALAIEGGATGENPVQPASTEAGAGAKGMIAQGRALLDKSASTRRIIEDLLVAN